MRYLVTLPLNLVPGVGTAVFLLLNGRKAGPCVLAASLYSFMARR